MSSPIVIHMHRPYVSEEEYIAHERFSIEAKSMLLIDQPALPLDTAVVFDVTLDNGQKPIRAEARVIGYVEAQGDRPGGLRVRFRRFGAATKAFIDRALNGPFPPAAEPGTAVANVTPTDAAKAAVAAVTAVAGVTHDAADAAPAARAELVSASAPASDGRITAPAETPTAVRGTETTDSEEASGIHKKTGAPSVVAPANREALLARLRGRRVS